MFYRGVRRCDLCASELLGQRGDDICLICRLAMEDDAVSDRAHEAEEREEVEEFALTAVIGQSHIAASEAVAANDEAKGPLERARRKVRGGFNTHRLAAGLRSIARRCLR